MSEFRPIQLPSGQMVDVPSDMPMEEVRTHLMKRFPDEFDSPTNTHFNRARVAATAVPETLAEIGGLPVAAFRGVQWLRKKLGDDATKADAEKTIARLDALPSIKKGIEQDLGIPTSPQEEAKRLGVKYDRPLEAITEGVKMATGTMALGGTGRLAALAGTGAGTGSLIDQEYGPLAGGLLGTLGGAKLASSAARKQAAKAVPTSEQLGRDAATAFDDMRQAGAVVSPQALARLDARIAADMGRQNFRPAIHAQTSKVLKELADDITQGPSVYRSIGNMGRPGVQGPISFEQLHGFRQVVNEGIKGSVPASADARLLSRIKSKLDDFLGSLTMRDVVAGDPIRASAAIKRGTALYRQHMKSQEIAALMEKARNNAPGFSQTGMDKAIRDQFKQLANSPRRMRMFTPVEQAQIRRIAQSTMPMNLLRFFGGMAPRGALTGALHGVNIAANPALGVPLAGALHGARFMATRSRMNAERALDELIRAGSPIQAPPVFPLALPGIGSAAINN